MKLRMRNAGKWVVAAAAAAALSVSVVSAGSDRDRGKAAANSVIQQWGTGDKLEQKAMNPMASDAQMKSIDGQQSFGVQMSCPGSQKFMRLTMLPSSQGDLQSLAMDLDNDLDGSQETRRMFNGPYAAVCNNGLIQCPSGTMNNCAYFRWRADSSGVVLDRNNDSGLPNTQADLGGCYCFNNSCGNGLLIRNSDKILDDVGAGIAVAMQQQRPRFAISNKTTVDTLSAEYFGQQGGCGADKQPEQYFKNTGSLQSEGQVAASDPNSTYAKILASPVSQGHGATEASCVIQRQFSTENYDSEVLSYAFRDVGSVTSCGVRCNTVTIGNIDLAYRANCGMHTQAVAITVNKPQLVRRVTLLTVGHDDWLRLFVNGTQRYTADSRWTYPGARCGENGNRGVKTLNMDLTELFRSTPAGGIVDISYDLSYADKGRGEAVLQVETEPDCRIATERIVNGCATLESRTDCRLRDETVDGVYTWRGYGETGLSPLPSKRTVTQGACGVEVVRAWYDKYRVYTCPAGESPYGGEDAKKRHESVRSSFDPASGNYSDTRKEDGSWSSHSGSVTLMPPDPVEACVSMCRTRKLRPGVAVTESGAVNQKNPNGPAYDYTYRECSNNVCATEPGEEVVSACNCRSSFGEAAAMMQTIRQTKQDMLCQPN